MKKQISILSVSLMALSVLFSGCATTGMFTAANITNVELAKGNYKIVSTSLVGKASAEYILGASFGFGMYTQTMALIPLSKDRQLYRLALEDLWKTFEAKHGSPTGRKLALVNLRYDSETLNLLIYTKPTVSVIADVVEFFE